MKGGLLGSSGDGKEQTTPAAGARSLMLGERISYSCSVGNFNLLAPSHFQSSLLLPSPPLFRIFSDHTMILQAREKKLQLACFGFNQSYKKKILITRNTNPLQTHDFNFNFLMSAALMFWDEIITHLMVLCTIHRLYSTFLLERLWGFYYCAASKI